MWEFAKEKEYTIITFDADFVDLNILFGHPPKIIWLRIGNTATDYLAQKLLDKENEIKEFLSGETFKDIGCLEILG
ncbi:MAG: DUF5615 family PIN-like protein [Cyclobacteriaceae bacterium]|nr:DUF5615 family PIN-like protein [Cyclobacteriaceae bacterium]MCH8517425.1 DUF5615 family PIN-like protein [Cyclobacteriaceae bacterium]